VAIVTVFRSRLRPGVEDAYGVVAQEMSRLAHAMSGFLEEKMFLAADGERCDHRAIRRSGEPSVVGETP
jgi:antibiotic biosynthesis monooxygenase (ABM) superfamily enzyme